MLFFWWLFLAAPVDGSHLRPPLTRGLSPLGDWGGETIFSEGELSPLGD